MGARLPSLQALERMSAPNAEAVLEAWERETRDQFDSELVSFDGTPVSAYRRTLRRRLDRIAALSTALRGGNRGAA